MEFVGRNSICALKEVIKNYQNLLMFHGKTTFARYGTLFSELLTGKNISYYSDFTNNPKKEEIDLAKKNFSDRKFDAIIAFGGGSVIDFAKAFRFYKQENVPLIAIPTTAGTGSEATQFAVVYVNGIKTSLDDISILPDVAIVDSQFIENTPAYVKACCAMDAYCQAIESFWAKKATEQSREYALSAIKLCHECIEKAVNTADIEANEKMALAAHLAGRAINISRTTAAHALSYKITSQYNIPHGHAVALNIANLFVYNMDNFNVEPILDILDISKFEVVAYFDRLMERIGLETSFEKLGITDIEAIVNSVNVERLQNNPAPLTEEDLRKIVTRECKND